MQRMSIKQYGKYSKEARKRGENVYDRNSAHAHFQSSFYEADKQARNAVIKKTFTIVAVITFFAALITFVISTM